MYLLSRCILSLNDCISRFSTADFLRELPVIVKRAAPSLDLLFPEEEQRLLSSVRELQTAFVHSIVLAKKAKVRSSLLTLAELPEVHGIHYHELSSRA